MSPWKRTILLKRSVGRRDLCLFYFKGKQTILGKAKGKAERAGEKGCVWALCGNEWEFFLKAGAELRCVCVCVCVCVCSRLPFRISFQAILFVRLGKPLCAICHGPPAGDFRICALDCAKTRQHFPPAQFGTGS